MIIILNVVNLREGSLNHESPYYEKYDSKIKEWRFKDSSPSKTTAQNDDKIFCLFRRVILLYYI
jgi:hypothetical protein